MRLNLFLPRREFICWYIYQALQLSSGIRGSFLEFFEQYISNQQPKWSSRWHQLFYLGGPFVCVGLLASSVPPLTTRGPSPPSHSAQVQSQLREAASRAPPQETMKEARGHCVLSLAIDLSLHRRIYSQWHGVCTQAYVFAYKLCVCVCVLLHLQFDIKCKGGTHVCLNFFSKVSIQFLARVCRTLVLYICGIALQWLHCVFSMCVQRNSECF